MPETERVSDSLPATYAPLNNPGLIGVDDISDLLKRRAAIDFLNKFFN